MAFFKPAETSQQQKVVGETQWHNVSFEFKDPILKKNNFNPDKQQLVWGIALGHDKMSWGITQKSVEEMLNAIGPVNGTVVRVAKIRTGPKAIEVEWAVEYVSGEREPRHIRLSIEAGKRVPLNATTDSISQQVRGGGGGSGHEEPFYDEDDDYFGTQGIPAEEVKVQRREDRPWDEDSEAGAEAAQYIYPPLDEGRLELIYTLAKDQAKMAAITLAAFRKEMPDDIPEEEIHTYVRGGLVGLSFDILSLDRDGRIPRAGLMNYTPIVPLPSVPEQKEVSNQVSDVVEEVEDDMTLEQKQDAAAMLIGLSASEFTEQLFKLLAKIHPRVTDVNHARNILKKKLGYETLPRTDEESLRGMIHEFLVYNDARTEGLDDETACITVSNECGRHPELMPPLKDDGK